jgi:PAS domain S-box-containing protein
VTGRPIRVVVAENDRELGRALDELIAGHPDLELVGLATDHEEARRLAAERGPDVVLMDVCMPGGAAATSTRAIRATTPRTRVVALSAIADPGIVLDLLSAGAAGYLVKGGASAEDIVETIVRAARGWFSMPADLAATIMEARAAPKLFRQLVESSPDAMVITDQAGRIRLVNAEAEHLFGYERRQLLGGPLGRLLPDHPLTVSLRDWARPHDEAGGHSMELVARHSGGRQFPVDVSASPLDTDEGPMMVMTIRDITEVRRAQLVLEHSLELLEANGQDYRSLLSHLVRAQEDERGRIAAGLHDDTIQVITAASLRLQQLRRRLRDPADLAVLDRLEETVKLSLTRLRQVIFDLRPPDLNHGDLAAVLHSYLDQMRVETGVDYSLENDLSAVPPADTTVFIYRIAQEALMNVRKHARASRVRVQLLSVDDGCLVRITDDGVGYDPLAIETRPGHLGLTLIQERAEIAGGWSRIESAPGAGTTVEFWVPVGGPAAEAATGGPPGGAGSARR